MADGYLCIIGSHEVTKIAGWNADIDVLAHCNGSRLDEVEVSTDVKHNLTNKTSPVDGVSDSVINICALFTSAENYLHSVRQR